MSSTNTPPITESPNDTTPTHCSTATTTQAGVAAASDVSVSKTAPATVPQTGGNITYSITASHTGNTAATEVTETDTLPAGTTFICSNATQGTWNAETTVA